MAKNWEKVEITIDKGGKAVLTPVKEKESSVKKSKKLDLRHVKSLSFEELKKEGDKIYADNRFKEDALVEAYNDKKVKSQTLIKKAKSVIAKRAKEEVAAQKKAAQDARRDKIIDTNTATV